MNSIQKNSIISINGVDCIKGVLRLIECSKEEARIRTSGGRSFGMIEKPEYYTKPIIVSKTELVRIGDKYLRNGGVFDCEDGLKQGHLWEQADQVSKVLVLPENFSLKHIEDICEGKLKDGTSVFVECIRHNSHNTPDISQEELDLIIKLNNNHINLVEADKEDGWNDIDQHWMEEHPPFSGPYPRFHEWLKENYNPPTRKGSK